MNAISPSGVGAARGKKKAAASDEAVHLSIESDAIAEQANEAIARARGGQEQGAGQAGRKAEGDENAAGAAGEKATAKEEDAADASGANGGPHGAAGSTAGNPGNATGNVAGGAHGGPHGVAGGAAGAAGTASAATSTGSAASGKGSAADGAGRGAKPMVPPQLAAVEVLLSVEIGSRKLPLGDLLDVDVGQLFSLDRLTTEPVTILVNGNPFAKGEVVAMGERFGVRLVAILPGGAV